MLRCLSKPLEELEKAIDKLRRNRKLGDNGHYYHTDQYDIECEYIASRVTDKDKFEACIKEAMKKIKEADEYYTKNFNDSFPQYTPLRELVWVCKEDFEDYCGEELEEGNGIGCGGDILTSVTRYEDGEIHFSEAGVQYGLYKDVYDTYPF